MRDNEEIQQAERFCSVAVEAGLVEKEAADGCLETFRNSEEKEVSSISRIFRDRTLLGDTEIRGVYTAMNRLKRDASRDEIRIPGYKILSKIGDGGLGTVYKAKQLTMNRFVALKVLHPKWLSDKEFYNRFILEARIIGKMSHQNLLQVYDVGQVENLLYFSMEFVDGETVEDYIENHGPMPVGVATNIVRQVARALNYIKEFDVVHRDVKPGNILLTRNGVAKLGDFGFLKSTYDSKIANKGEVLGTPDYIAPEQAAGKVVDFRADMYSLGVTYYHMLIGKVPFDGSVSEVIRQHMRVKFPSLKETGKELPDEIGEVIEKMTAKHPESRYPSFGELFNDLESIRFKENLSSDQLDMSRSTIISAFRGESTRNQKLSQENALLRKRVKILTAVLGASTAVLILLAVYLWMRGRGLL